MKVYLLNRVKNIVANGEIAHYKQFHHLPQYFQKSSAAEASERVYRWERVILLPDTDVVRCLFSRQFDNNFYFSCNN